MNSGAPPPPPPPPHGSTPRSANGNGSGLPPGNYDIFIIPPHSAGSGFLYLPSLQPNRNSFLAGVASTLLVVGIWQIVGPVMKHWLGTVVASGGNGVVILILGVGIAGWAWGRTQTENAGNGSGNGGTGSGPTPQQGPQSGPSEGAYNGAGAGGTSPGGGQQYQQKAPPKPSWGTNGAGAGASSAWEKARQETKKREEERKRAEELKKKQEEEAKKKEEAERAAKAQAEKEKWEQMRAREREAREREARERLAKERLEKEREKLEKEKEAKKKAAAADPSGLRFGVGERTDPYAGSTLGSSRPYEKPSARSWTENDEATSFRPYDTPPKRTHKANSASSFVSESPSFYSSAPSHSTARTTPPPSQRGPYSTKDPDKIVIKAVYLFNNMFPKPVAQLISGIGSVTDGLILRITTEGCFVDDDVRGVGQREWDVKAWGMKLVETGTVNSMHVLRASIRDAEGKRYVFVISEAEAWKVAVGLQRLRRGTQVRSLGVNGMAAGEVKRLLEVTGW